MTYRAIGMGLACAVAVCGIVSWAELVVMYIQIGMLQFPPVAIGGFFLLLLADRLARRFRKRMGLDPAELVTVYVMMLLAAMVSSRGLMEKWLPVLVAPNYYANASNRWQKLFFPHIPHWMVPFDPGKGEQQPVAKWFYEGLHYGEPIPWRDWAVPILCWLVLIGAVFGAFLCLAAILRRQWVDGEKLSFPLVQLPLEMARTQESGAFLTNRLTWLGAAVPAFFFTLNGLHNIFPSVPGVPLEYNLNQFVVSRPWSDIDLVTAYCSFAGIGFFYFLASELLFALWFFFLLARFQDIVASSFGMVPEGMPLYPTRLFIGYQVAGAYCILAGYLFYVSLPHLKGVVRQAFGKSPADDSGELLSYRTAFWGLCLALAVIVGWLVAAGMSLWLAVFQMAVYLLVVSLVMARSAAEAGMPMTETSFRPVDLVSMVVPRSHLGPTNLTLLTFMDAVFTRDLRGLLLAGFLDSSKLGDGVRFRRKRLVWVFLVTIAVSIAAAGFFQLWLPYRRGAITMYSYPYWGNSLWGFQDNAPAMEGGLPFNWRAPVFFGVGACVTLFLAAMRARFWWWPFHPMGYALCASWSMIVFWFPILIAWVLKTLIARYGGMRLYTQARPFFLGLILGEFTMAVFWTGISALTRAPAPSFPWP
ncbi:MAG: hypothetical protein IT210_01555 [Armatimonadetes bacterium]|nr:hypothetical protein [Armatimonadota bacterium]